MCHKTSLAWMEKLGIEGPPVGLCEHRDMLCVVWLWRLVRYQRIKVCCGSAGKESACNAGGLGLIPGLGRSPGKGKGYPLQYSGLENSMGSQRVRHDWATFTSLTPKKWTKQHPGISGWSSYAHLSVPCLCGLVIKTTFLSLELIFMRKVSYFAEYKSVSVVQMTYIS